MSIFYESISRSICEVRNKLRAGAEPLDRALGGMAKSVLAVPNPITLNDSFQNVECRIYTMPAKVSRRFKFIFYEQFADFIYNK